MEVKEYHDVMPKLYEAFPHLNKTLIKYIVKVGFYVMGAVLRKGHDISVGKRGAGITLASHLSRKSKYKKAKRRNNLLYEQKKKQFKGEYYFSVVDGYESNLTKKGDKYILRNVYCSKEIQSVCGHAPRTIYALELTDVGMDFYIDELETDRVRMVIRRDGCNK